MKTYSGVEV